MTVTIGGRGTRSSSASASWEMALATSVDTYSVVKPNSSATILMVSASRRWLMETITPRFIQVAMTWLMGTFIITARSLAVTNSVSFSIFSPSSSAAFASRTRSALASRFSLRHLAPFFRPLSLAVRRARVSLTCFETSSSETSGVTGRTGFEGRAWRFSSLRRFWGCDCPRPA